MSDECDNCDAEAEGQIIYEDGEIFVGCSDCILEIAADPAKPIQVIEEYDEYGEP